ncbi:hypothetical protein CTheo_9203 [Ceratobasidium theobromae]|uniref:Uncharacterized protein n=1 Tax=Ceratobasidium theobromae TaxID=1582974 RepID=A0A5N5Q5U2_9AGAM|nr:hypothetical protein CTheo_9203 [Ceratobasidium theobromae]
MLDKVVDSELDSTTDSGLGIGPIVPGDNVNGNRGDDQMDVENLDNDTLAESVQDTIEMDSRGENSPQLESVPIRRNPPVTIEDWPDPDDDFCQQLRL